MPDLLTLFLTFFITLLVMALLRRAAPRLGLVDAPSAHRHHELPTPMVGGIAIFTGFFFGLLASDLPLGAYRPLFLGCGILVLVGVLDDVHELSSLSRFAAQILAALVMVHYGGVRLVDFGDLVGNGVVVLGMMSVPLTVFATVGVINAMNMVDGMDGLAGSLFLVAFGALALLAGEHGARAGLPILLMISLGVTAFLLFNARLGLRSHATVFLGDAGSMFLGFVLCWFLVRFSQAPLSLIDPVTALWLLAVPLVDTVSVMLRRMLYRHSPFTADRTHLHHLLAHRGLSVDAVLLVMVSLAVLAATAGIVMQRSGCPEAIRFSLFLGLFAGHFALSGWYVHRHRLVPPRASPRSRR